MRKIIIILSLFLLSNFIFAAEKLSLPTVKTTTAKLGKVQNMKALTLSRMVFGTPTTSGNYIVWEDGRSGNRDIYGMDKTTGIDFSICTKPNSQFGPYIDGDIVVWTDFRSPTISDVFAYRLSTKTEFHVGSSTKNRVVKGISGNYILWSEYFSTNNYRIIAYDYAHQIQRIIVSSIPVAPSAAIDEDIVVWTDYRNGNPDIYVYSLSLNREFAISTNSFNQTNPTISEGVIVWLDNRNNKTEIWGYDMSVGTEFLIYSPSSVNVHSPHIGKRYVVFEKDNDIYSYHLDTKILARISDGLHEYANASIKDNFVVWTNVDAGINGDIFSAILPDIPAVKQFIIQDEMTQRFFVNKLEWVFNTDTNIQQLITDGTIINAIKIVNVGTRAKTKPIYQEIKLNVSDFSYDEDTRTLTWDYGNNSVPEGLYEAILSAPYIVSEDGTHPVSDIFTYFSCLNGDINGDGIINSLDLIIFNNSFGTKVGDTNWNANADLDGNLKIDYLDYLKLKSYFGRYIEEP